VILQGGTLWAQMPVQSVKRQEIDAKRMGTSPMSNDAIYRAREFLRTDSTYYVGWMYEGLYKVNHAADFLGYKNAIEPLKKALKLLERDYAAQLRTRSGDLRWYFPAYHFQLDYSMIASELAESYNDIEQPQQAFQVALNARKWNFQRPFYFPAYVQMAWIVHRNRFYTSANYSFLENSIPANEALANAYLDSALRKIRVDARLNNTIFQPGYQKLERQTVYHYKAILYSYALNIDSAAKYYNLLKEGPLLSYNNYGTFLSICGHFREAAHNYAKASTQDAGDKRLQEWAYYASILKIYQAKPKVAVQDMSDMIKAVGSTPGFGWYNIALSRAESYDGNLTQSERHVTKAENFKEVNIGTTLGKSQYDFSVNMIKLRNQINRIRELKFENSGWWYNPFTLASVAKQTSQKYLLEYLIVNQLALNPERDKVIYPLFSTESTVSWDEIWFLIRDFSTSFFYKQFQQELKNDKRPLIKKYYRLFMARLQMEQGNYPEAEKALSEIVQDPSIDEGYEKLFLARCYEALSICARETHHKSLEMESSLDFYATFPQLVPFSDYTISMRLHTLGKADKKLLDRLKDCNINWVSEQDIAVPEITLIFHDEGGKKSVTYFVTAPDGRELIKRSDYYYKPEDAEAAGLTLAYHLFKIEKEVAD
jgi:Tfp pilus assembly protein PilF